MDTLTGPMPRQDNEIDLEDLVKAVASGGGRDLAHSETLPPAAYTSQSFFDLEVEKIFKPGWVCVGHISQIPNAGDYFSIDLFKEMLVVVRGKDDVVRVLSRICTHRWAPLTNGCGNAKLFSCPFHKWGFDLAGNLLGAPLMDQVEFETSKYNLPSFATEVVDGFIFTNLSNDAEPFAPQIKDFSEKMKKFGFGELVMAGGIEYECQFNWKIMAETFMECYHHIAAHEKTFEAQFPARLSYIEEGSAAWTYGVVPAKSTVSTGEIELGLHPLADDLSELERRSFFLYLVYPQHLLAVWSDRVYWFRSQPVGPDKTLLQTYVLVHPEAKKQPDYEEIMKREMEFMDMFNNEDITVNTMQQRGAETASALPGRLSHLEKAIWQLSDYIRSKTAD
ncbi:aromatic ring-hydroxylating oxygenase subunit alpha [Xanthobacter sp. ZOL 2024]